MRAFFKTREGLDSPDAMFTMQPFLVTPDLKLAKEPGITIITHQLRPESKGSVHVAARDAGKPPAIRFNFLAERIDRDCLLASMRMVRRLVAAPRAGLARRRRVRARPESSIRMRSSSIS